MNARVLSLRTIALALGGEVSGRSVLAPGPRHDRRDRSLHVTLSDRHPEGFVVRSYSGDDWRECRDYVRERCGLPSCYDRDRPRSPPASPTPSRSRPDPVEAREEALRKRRAAALWAEAVSPRGTLVETYLATRCLELPDDGGEAIRFHPACPWVGETRPTMLAAMRTIRGDEMTAVHRTALTPAGEKIGRKMLGIAAGTAIKLDADERVEQGLIIGEGIETVLAARQLGYRPAWALGSVDAVRLFPILPGIDALTILEESGEASARAVEECGTRWHSAGRGVRVVRSKIGSDVNDALMRMRS